MHRDGINGPVHELNYYQETFCRLYAICRENQHCLGALNWAFLCLHILSRCTLVVFRT